VEANLEVSIMIIFVIALVFIFQARFVRADWRAYIFVPFQLGSRVFGIIELAIR